jgi:CheY-like chemotaxis protein
LTAKSRRGGDWVRVLLDSSLETLSRIPVVIVSADSRADEHARALRASGCLKKPIRLDDLIESVERVC